jgi:hypothetical protein
MEKRAPRTRLAPVPEIPAGRRSDPKIRKQMTGPALRTFFNVAEAWKLTNEEQRALLGWPAEATFYNYKAGKAGTLPYDMLMRISLILGIYKNLQILYPEAGLADQWIRLPNSNPLFGGKPAMALLAGGEMDALYQVRRLLDGRRGGWN